MDALINLVVGGFDSFPITVQFLILVILCVVSVTAHIAPYTANKFDDLAIPLNKKLKGLIGGFFNIVAGNYKNAKNKDKDKEW